MESKNVFYDELCLAVYTTNRYFHQLYQLVLTEYDLTYLQYMALLSITQYEKCTLSQICLNLDLDTNTLTPVVKKLIQKGWINKEKSLTDGRSFELALTGKAMLNFKVIQAKIAKIQAKLVGSEHSKFISILNEAHELNERVAKVISEQMEEYQ